MPLKILIYTDDYGAGGAGEYTHTVALGLAAAGHRVIYAQSRVDKPEIREREAAGIRHRWIDYDTINYIVHTAFDTITPTRILVEERPDVVLFCDCLPESTVAAKHAAQFLGIPFLSAKLFVGTDSWMSIRPDLRNYTEAGLRAAAAVICVSQENRTLLLRQLDLDPSRLKVVHMGRPDRFFQPRDEARRQRLRAEWGVAGDEVLFLSMAQFVQRKGYQHIIAAMRRLKDQGSLGRIRCAWIGHADNDMGRQHQEALRQAGLADRVVWLGFRSDGDACLDAADAFILPSEREGMPLAVMEAMAKGVPVIGSAVSGIPEEIADTGILLPDPNSGAAATVEALAAAMAQLAGDAARRAELGRRTRERAQTMFRSERMIGETLDLLTAAAFAEDDRPAAGLDPLRLDRCFPFRQRYEERRHGRPALRPDTGRALFVDSRAPQRILLSREEVSLIHANARQFKGLRALEIGPWMGWTTLHLAAAGLTVDVLGSVLQEPVVNNAQVEAIARFRDLATAERLDSPAVNLFCGNEDAAVLTTLAGRAGEPWALCVLDGADGKLVEMAQACAGRCRPDAMILLPRTRRPGIDAAVDQLKRTGWTATVYDTIHGLTVLWRGRLRPVPQPSAGGAPEAPRYIRAWS